jgi:hypothetical protein
MRASKFVVSIEWYARKRIGETEESMSRKWTSNGYEIDDSPDKFGELRDSNALLGNEAALKDRMKEDGYVYLRDYLDKDVVLAARHELLSQLASVGEIDEDHPLMDGIASGKTGRKSESGKDFWKDIRTGPALRNLVHKGNIIAFFESFLGGEVRAFDFIWLRFIKVGPGSGFHYDWLYMGRGTPNLYTAWIPIGDVPLTDGPITFLENSHRLEDVRNTYGKIDIDQISVKHDYENGWLGRNPVEIQKKYGGRLLTADFKVGDVVVFPMWMLHGSLDNVNESGRIRISSDTRYQLMSEPADHRWIGDDPIAHGAAAKR